MSIYAICWCLFKSDLFNKTLNFLSRVSFVSEPKDHQITSLLQQKYWVWFAFKEFVCIEKNELVFCWMEKSSKWECCKCFKMILFYLNYVPQKYIRDSVPGVSQKTSAVPRKLMKNVIFHSVHLLWSLIRWEIKWNQSFPGFPRLLPWGHGINLYPPTLKMQCLLVTR